MKKICEKCKFWKQEQTTAQGTGSCHKYPPLAQKSGKFVFSQTRWCDWCGEFKLGQTQKRFIDTIKASLSPRARNVLRRLSIATKSQLLNLAEDDYQKLKNCGGKTRLEIQNLQKRIKEKSRQSPLIKGLD